MQPVSTQRVFSDRYELTHLVARGGMAQVYRARDRLLDRPVALKVLFPELSVDRAFVERFKREAMAAANLSHPNIVPVFDWGEDAGTYFIVMEYIDGHPLSAVLRDTGPMPFRRVAEIGSQVAAALSYAHRHGVVHRDVKPGNVLITDDGQVKVTDFGIARAVNTEESLTQTGAVMGTATYFSPEQAEGMGVDARSDVYSLGVVMYEMVAGRPPFLGETPVSIASKHVRDRPPLLRDLNPAVPPALEAVIAKAMAKSADQRYQSADELRSDLAQFVEGRPVSAADDLTAVLGNTGVIGAVDPVTATQAAVTGDGTLAAARAQEAARRTRRRRILLVAGLLLAAAVVVALVLVGKSLGWFGTSGFSMPTVVGKTKAAATATLNRHGLKVGAVKTTQSTTKVGTVIKTLPQAGHSVTKGQSVSLFVSTGPPKLVTVPNVVGQQLATAGIRLKDAGLKYTETQVPSTKPSGQVIGQSPGPGKSVKAGSTVHLKVSSQSSVTVPNVVGQTQSKAGGTIAGDGLAVGNAVSHCSNTTPLGMVSAQTPPAGKQVAPKTVVNMTVSSGSCTAAVPNVIGQTSNAAGTTLRSHGFANVTTSTTGTCSSTTNGKVVTQSPKGGTTQATTKPVTITVCSVPNPTTTTSTSTTTTSAKSSHVTTRPVAPAG